MDDKLAKHIVRRIDQRMMLQDWLSLHPDFQVQVNFSVPNTEEHLCVGISSASSFQLGMDVVRALDLQIENMKSKL